MVIVIYGRYPLNTFSIITYFFYFEKKKIMAISIVLEKETNFFKKRDKYWPPIQSLAKQHLQHWPSESKLQEIQTECQWPILEIPLEAHHLPPVKQFYLPNISKACT